MAEPELDARGRLQQAAIELFREHGYDRTTASAIATRAGVTDEPSPVTSRTSGRCCSTDKLCWPPR